MPGPSARKEDKAGRRRRSSPKESESIGERLAKQLGQRIRELRKRQGITLLRFAKMTGLSQSGLSYIENGVKGPKTETLLRIAATLNVEPVELFDFPEDIDTKAAMRAGRVADKDLMDAALHSREFAKVAGALARLHLDRPKVFRAFIQAMDGLLKADPGRPKVLGSR